MHTERCGHALRPRCRNGVPIDLERLSKTSTREDYKYLRENAKNKTERDKVRSCVNRQKTENKKKTNRTTERDARVSAWKCARGEISEEIGENTHTCRECKPSHTLHTGSVVEQGKICSKQTCFKEKGKRSKLLTSRNFQCHQIESLVRDSTLF